MDKPQSPIAVLGGGSWGTALAVLLAGNGQQTLLWARDAAQAAEMASSRCNTRYLPGISLPPQLQVHSDLDRVVRAAGDVLVVVPTQGFRALLQRIAPLLTAQARVAWACKGLEPDSGMLLHEVAVEVLGTQRYVAVISGPTFAREVALGLPTAVTVASATPSFATALAARLGNSRFRAYTSKDVIGVELGGAVKNVMAIAAGFADGLGFGANTRAALVTRGLAEMMRMGVILEGQ
ncbi:MAG: NAD(P)-dependent glycerol-3-phosphate dehydrogenase, partial [Gammaproteobacteria bacterium]